MATTSKNVDKSPARKNYWSRRHLETNKVKRMMRAYGLDEKQAKERWLAERKSRIPSLFVKDFTQGDASTHKKKVRVRHSEEELYAFELIGFRNELRNKLVVNLTKGR